MSAPVPYDGRVLARVVRVLRALVNEPRVVLADEPTGDLDRESGRRIMQLLQTLPEQCGLTLVLVTHDPELAATAPRRIRILDGRVA